MEFLWNSMEYLWNPYGATREQQASNALATRQQRARNRGAISWQQAHPGLAGRVIGAHHVALNPGRRARGQTSPCRIQER